MGHPSETKRCNPVCYTREQLQQVDSPLRDRLSRETRISVRGFVGQYLPILDFLKDVCEVLERGEVNLFEAHQFARLTAKRLGRTDSEARLLRITLLEVNLLA